MPHNEEIPASNQDLRYLSRLLLKYRTEVKKNQRIVSTISEGSKKPSPIWAKSAGAA
jgi:hypothetical protein